VSDPFVEWDTYLRFVAALVFVLALMGVLSWLLRRSGWGGRTSGGRRRLAVVEMLSIDPRRRLVLVRRDGVEHLLLLGAQGDRVIERDIGAASFRQALDATPETTSEEKKV